jgi:hypothetical protein
MINNFMQILSYCVPPASQGTYVSLLGIYLSSASTAVARSFAYRTMWAIIAPGVSNSGVQMAFAFGRMAMAAAGATWGVIAQAYAAIAAFMAGTGGLVVLVVIIAVLLLILAWMAFESWKQKSQQVQRQQNIELEQNTRKMFGVSMIPFQTVANDPSIGPMYPIQYQQLQPGCSVG